MPHAIVRSLLIPPVLLSPLPGTYPFRRSGDAALKPNQKLNAMLQRILEADYSFPANRPLSEGEQSGWLALLPSPAAAPAAAPRAWAAAACSPGQQGWMLAAFPPRPAQSARI